MLQRIISSKRYSFAAAYYTNALQTYWPDFEKKTSEQGHQPAYLNDREYAPT